jgi:hypothetical protein
MNATARPPWHYVVAVAPAALVAVAYVLSPTLGGPLVDGATSDLSLLTMVFIGLGLAMVAGAILVLGRTRGSMGLLAALVVGLLAGVELLVVPAWVMILANLPSS